MGSTNKTAHYELPQFVANDKPSWLGDVNEAMEAIDTGIYGAKSSADGAQQTANNAVAGVASAGTRMDGIQTQLDTVATQANQTATTVAGHTSSIATNSANINTLNSRMGSTDISAIGDGTVTGAIDALAQGGSGGATLKATANSGQTYAAQLTALQSAWSALTADEKVRAYITTGSKVFRVTQTTAGNFATLTVQPTLSEIDGTVLDIVNAHAKAFTLTSTYAWVDYDTHVDSDEMKLYA